VKKKVESKPKAIVKSTAAKKKTTTVKRVAKVKSVEKEEIIVDDIKSKRAVKTRKPRSSAKQMVIREAVGVELAKIIAQGMFEKKAEDIRILDLRGLAGASTDFFVISHAVSDKQVEAIADSAEDETYKATNEWPQHREGYENLEWILLDYFDVVAHVFQEEKREFYGLEQLWGDAKEVPFKGK